ncbi:MAG TPA: TonB family protein [Xanthomonadaceae bacterium]|jgi:protein TonB
MVRSANFPQFSQPRPDPIRIAAIAASIAANVALFAFLMQPLSYSPPAEPETTPVTFPDPIPHKPEVVKLKPEPPKPHPQPTPAPPRPVLHESRPIPVIKTDTGPMDIKIPPQPPAIDSGKLDIQPPGPVETSLNAIAAPAPAYPIPAIRDGVTGTVDLELLVGVDGHVLEAKVVHSSGDRRLDAAAREQVLRSWVFQPAMRNGMPVQARGLVPIVFNLNGQ